MDSPVSAPANAGEAVKTRQSSAAAITLRFLNVSRRCIVFYDKSIQGQEGSDKFEENSYCAISHSFAFSILSNKVNFLFEKSVTAL